MFCVVQGSNTSAKNLNHDLMQLMVFLMNKDV